MGRPRSANPKIHVSIVKIKRKSDDYFDVYEQRSIYDPATKNSKGLGRKKIGILPINYTDFDKELIKGIDKRTKAGKELFNPTAVESSNNVNTNAFKEIKDPRQASKVIYPLHHVLLVIILASLAGYSSARQIALYWKVNKAGLQQWFSDFPNEDISHDTVRKIIAIIGKARNCDEFVTKITAPLLEQLQRRHLAIDGQAVRAATIDNKKAPYIFNCFDVTNGLTIRQLFIDVKSNEISHSKALIENLDLRGCIITADALNTHKSFIKFLIQNQCDYCLALKGNHKLLEQDIISLFANAPLTKQRAQAIGYPQWLCVQEDSLDLEHGRIEKRTTKVLPASLLIKDDEPDFIKDWEALEDGCVAMVTNETTNKKTGEVTTDVRYFISSLYFDEEHIAARIAQLVREHWHIENKLHWELDVTFNQDRTQCSNVEFLKGRSVVNKIIYNFMTKAQQNENKNRKEKIFKPQMKVMFSNLDYSLSVISDLLK